MYLDISLEHCNINIINIVEVEGSFPKRKWIMGVCDLNYWLVCADICLYPSATLHWNSQSNVSLLQPPHKFHTEDRLVRLKKILSMIKSESCRTWTGSVRSSRISELEKTIIMVSQFTYVKLNSMEMQSFPLHWHDLWYYRSETRDLKKNEARLY